MENDMTLREKLHKYIDIADKKKLEAIYVLVENDIVKGNIYSKEDIEHFYDRRRRNMEEGGQNYSVDESISLIRKNSKG
jgi:hypothetical protein